MTRPTGARKRRWFVPEAVQTSDMDCGPAVLKAILDGYGHTAEYEELRELCGTAVDGTSINRLEQVLRTLGFDARQVLLPPDHVVLTPARSLPSIAVVTRPDGFPHFVVAWNRTFRRLQLMDPAVGRRWTTAEAFTNELLVHRVPMLAGVWRRYAGTDEHTGCLRQRLRVLGVNAAESDALLHAALADEGWRSVAALDAGIRAVAELVRGGGLHRGKRATNLLREIVTRSRAGDEEVVPERYWSVRAMAAGPNLPELLEVRGAVVVRVPSGGTPATSDNKRSTTVDPGQLPSSLDTRRPPLWRNLCVMACEGDRASPILVALAILVGSAGVLLEALLFRGLLEAGAELGIPEQRFGFGLGVLVFVALLLLLEAPIRSGAIRFGRLLELRIRMALLGALPNVPDHYFHTRLVSDMAARGHSVHRLRELPQLTAQILKVGSGLVLTAIGVVALEPASAMATALLLAASVGLPLVARPILDERDLRVRTHGGALSRVYLDGFLGLLPIRSHAAERAMRLQHESLLVEWTRSGLKLQRGRILLEAVSSVVTLGLAVAIVAAHVLRSGDSLAGLLLVYWTLRLPTLGEQLCYLFYELPEHRNVARRLLEPLRIASASQEAKTRAAPLCVKESRGVALGFAGVTVRIKERTLLENVDIAIPEGSHVGVVGASGAGKSTLISLLLGVQSPTEGAIRVDGALLNSDRYRALRRETAWLDPSIQLWNRSLLDNLRYGNSCDATGELEAALEASELWSVVEQSSEGLQLSLGESGRRLSGGEGQRVRLARAMMRRTARLVLLDEPFRGLEREQRTRLLGAIRRLWRHSTILCVTHDIGELLSFDRVLVIDGGRIVEDGNPQALVAQRESHFAHLLAAEEALLESLNAEPFWRRLDLVDGQLRERPALTEAE